MFPLKFHSFWEKDSSQRGLLCYLTLNDDDRVAFTFSSRQTDHFRSFRTSENKVRLGSRSVGTCCKQINLFRFSDCSIEWSVWPKNGNFDVDKIYKALGDLHWRAGIKTYKSKLQPTYFGSDAHDVIRACEQYNFYSVSLIAFPSKANETRNTMIKQYIYIYIFDRFRKQIDSWEPFLKTANHVDRNWGLIQNCPTTLLTYSKVHFS